MRGGKIVTQKLSLTEKIRDPLHYVPKDTKKIIFLKSEAPKALYSSHSFIVSALIKVYITTATHEHEHHGHGRIMD